MVETDHPSSKGRKAECMKKEDQSYIANHFIILLSPLSSSSKAYPYAAFVGPIDSFFFFLGFLVLANVLTLKKNDVC